MNLCKFGIHDWEKFYDSVKISDILIEDLEKRGFVLKNIKDCIPFHTNGKIDIKQWGYFDDTDNLSGCIPTLATTKVCLKCNKVKRNYDLHNCFRKLDSIITRLTNEYNRREKAKTILGRN